MLERYVLQRALLNNQNIALNCFRNSIIVNISSSLKSLVLISTDYLNNVNLHIIVPFYSVN